MITEHHRRKIFGLLAFTFVLANCSGFGGRPTATEETVAGTLLQEIGCGEAIPARTFTLFSAERNFSSGWNHIANPEKAADFQALSQPYSSYNTNADQLREDDTCNGEKTYRTVLVKKFHTWDNTHANGLQTEIEEIPLADIASLEIELKVNSAWSVIPSKQQIAETFPWLTQAQVRLLDRGEANIDLVLSTGTSRANKILTIDQRKYANKWLRISIPVEHLNYYDEVNYVRTPGRYQDVKELAYRNLTITAESHNRKTVQSITGGVGTKPLFKEVDISIRSIHFVLK